MPYNISSEKQWIRLFAVVAVLLASAAVFGPAKAAAQAFGPGDVQDSFLQWPLPPGAEAYADIDGRRIHQYVVEQAEIGRRYRDQGHPKFWGRIIGASSDAESAEWMAAKFRTFGLSDVRIQNFDLPPQWFPQSYEVTVSSGSTTLELVSAQPSYGTPETPPGGLELEAAYVGLSTEADYLGHNVEGKAVFTYGMLGLPNFGGTTRAGEKGAAVVFEVSMLPGNMRYQSYPRRTGVPTFTLGNDDGAAVRELIEAAPPGQPVRVNVRLDVEMVPDLHTALVWGTLPGASDETVYVTAHRDGWFDAAGDNASGVAIMVGVAEHYAKIPQAQRPRTLVFVGLDGHHNSGEGSATGIRWMVDNRADLFAKTALMINAETHVAVQTANRPRYWNWIEQPPTERIVWYNTYLGQQWYAGGQSRPELNEIVINAFREFGVTYALEPEDNHPPATDMGSFWNYMPGVATSGYLHYFHMEGETPETVPWTGLEASTRAYSRIIDEVNKLELSDLQRPEEEETP